VSSIDVVGRDLSMRSCKPLIADVKSFFSACFVAFSEELSRMMLRNPIKARRAQIGLVGISRRQQSGRSLSSLFAEIKSQSLGSKAAVSLAMVLACS